MSPSASEYSPGDTDVSLNSFLLSICDSHGLVVRAIGRGFEPRRSYIHCSTKK
jgi:hypothetical protein